MANPSAANTAVIAHATTLGGSYTEIDGCNKATLKVAGEPLDTTDFKDTSAYRTRIIGLRNASLSLSLDYEATDTQQAALVTGLTAGTSVFLQYLGDGTNGFKGEAYITSISFDADVGGKSTAQVEAEFTGALTAVP